MKRLVTALIVTAMLATGGAALAQGQGAGQGCTVIPGVLEFDNPGRLFQFVRSVSGLNPAQAAALGGLTPGEAIQLFCR